MKINLEVFEPSIIQVSRSNVFEISYDNIVAFTFAYAGAMGDCGGLTVIHKADCLNFYHINRVYNDDEELVEMVDNSYFKPFADAIKSTGWLIPELEGWKKIEMGQGNYLFIRKQYLNELENLCNCINNDILKFRTLIYTYSFSIINLLFNDILKEHKQNIINSICHSPTLLGGIIGDIAGSRFEFNPIKNKNFELLLKGENYLSKKQTYKEYQETCRFTDDTVMTIAVANALLEANGNYDNLQALVIESMKNFGHKYPYAGYGAKFNRWLTLPITEPYNSFGNGSAMRISPVPYFAKSIDEVKRLSKLVTEVTHNHPEGIKGAEAVACCIWMALNNYSKYEIEDFVRENYYNLDYDYEELLKTYKHDESCQNSVPQSIFAFLISKDYEDAIRTAISMGGDADTMACIAGSIAEAYYGLPKELEGNGLQFLTDDLKEIIIKFQCKFKGK